MARTTLIPVTIDENRRERTHAELLDVVRRVRADIAALDGEDASSDDPADVHIRMMRKVFGAVDDDEALVDFMAHIVGVYKHAWWLVPQAHGEITS